MRKIVFVSMGVLILFIACSRGYLKDGSVSPAFELTRSYWVAPLPFLVRGPGITPDKFTRDRAYDYLTMQLQKTNLFYMKDKYTIQTEIDKMGLSRVPGIGSEKACEVAKKVGAELVIVTDLTLEPEGGGLPVLAFIQILDVKTKTVFYSGRGRAINPASYEAAAEVAIDNALNALLKKL